MVDIAGVPQFDKPGLSVRSAPPEKAPCVQHSSNMALWLTQRMALLPWPSSSLASTFSNTASNYQAAPCKPAADAWAL